MRRGEEGKASSAEGSCICNEPKGETAEIILCEFHCNTSDSNLGDWSQVWPCVRHVMVCGVRVIKRDNHCTIVWRFEV